MTNRISHVLPRSSPPPMNPPAESREGPQTPRWLSSTTLQIEQHPGKFFMAAVATGMVIAWWIKRR